MSIKVKLQTIFMPPTVVYDSGDTSESKIGKFFRDLSDPVVQIEVNGTTFYKSKEFYSDYSLIFYMAVAALILTIIAVAKRR